MAARASSIIHAATKEEVFADDYVQADETPVKFQDPVRKGVCGTGYFWVFYNPVRNLSYFAWRTGRGADCLDSIIPADFQGTIQCDGFQVYQRVAKIRAAMGRTIQLGGCLAHGRRYFYDARAEGEDATWVLLQIQKLYQIEARLRGSRAGPDDIKSERQTHSLPILQQIKERLDDLAARRKHLPRSLTGEAITYTLGQWDKLLVYLEDGRFQIDNNLVENSIRPTAIGKKNWLFMGDPKSGASAAQFYTLIGNCHRAGIDAQSYLTDLFTRLAHPAQTTRSLHSLTPHGWAADQKAAAETPAV
jgi:transposase